jgi:hypothetical protein
VKQVLIYWEGQTPYGGPLDYVFKVNGITVSASDPGDVSDGGDRIGAPILFFGNIWAVAYRFDITGLGLVTAGPNVLSLTELNNFGFVADGAGVLVIYEEPAKPSAEIALVDGIDLAFINFAGAKQSTVPQTFTFTPSDAERTARLSMFFSSIKGSISGFGDRPNSIDITIGGVTTTFSNLLYSSSGEEWDTLNLDITIPADASSLTVQAFSRDDFSTGDLPASLFWIAAGLSVPTPEEEGEGCTPGYWKQPHHLDSWAAPFDPTDLFSSAFEDAFPGKTLLEVLWQGGGGLNALGRHTVAALLNAQSGGVNYDLTVAEVIAQFNSVYPGTWAQYEALKNYFEGFNTQGCPLN